MQNIFPVFLMLLTAVGATLATARAALAAPYIQCTRGNPADADFPAPYPIRVENIGTDHMTYFEFDEQVVDAEIHSSGAGRATVSYKRTEYRTPVLYSFEFDFSHCHDNTGSAVLTWAVIEANGSPSTHDRRNISYSCRCWMD